MMVYPLGDKGLVIKWDPVISEKNLQEISGMADYLESLDIKGLGELVASYNALTVYYEPMVVSMEQIQAHISQYKSQEIKQRDIRPTLEIPVYYGGEDLEIVANHNNMTCEEVIKRHVSGDYLVYMIGFSPGFPYLGGMDKTIATPRKKEARLKIESGSVGIANEQTGIYTVDGPGGWQIIGKTPLKIFDPKRDEPSLLHGNMNLKFHEITYDDYINWEAKND